MRTLPNLITIVIFLFGIVLQARANSEAVNYFNKANPSLTPLTDEYVKIGDVQYHYVTAGKGPLLILYHGFPSFWYAWKFQIGELSKHFQVVVVDGLGSNLSDKPFGQLSYTLERLTQDLNQLAHHFQKDKPFYLVGHDWGGALSWSFARRYPNRLKKLVVLNAPPYCEYMNMLQNDPIQQAASRYISFISSSLGETLLSMNDSYLIWKLAYQKHLDNQRINTIEANLFREALARPKALHSAINWYRANLPKDIDGEPENISTPCSRISTPSLLIWGMQDKAFSRTFMSSLKGNSDQLHIFRIDEASHWPQFSHPERVNQAITQFFKYQ